MCWLPLMEQMHFSSPQTNWSFLLKAGKCKTSVEYTFNRGRTFTLMDWLTDQLSGCLTADDSQLVNGSFFFITLCSCIVLTFQNVHHIGNFLLHDTMNICHWSLLSLKCKTCHLLSLYINYAFVSHVCFLCTSYVVTLVADGVRSVRGFNFDKAAASVLTSCVSIFNKS